MHKPAIEQFEAFARQFQQRSRRGGKAAIPGAVLHCRSSGLRPAGDDRAGVVSEASRAEARQGARLHSRPDGHRHVHVLHRPGPDQRRAGLRARGGRERRLQRALLQYFKPENYADVRAALEEAGRLDLIGDGPECLIPARPPTTKPRPAVAPTGTTQRRGKSARRRLPPAPENGETEESKDGLQMN